MKKTFFFLFLLAYFMGYGQIINVEKRRHTAAIGWQGDIDVSVNFTHSTTDILQAKNSLKFQHYNNRNTYLFLGDISMMQVNKTSLLNDGFGHFRYNYDFPDSVLIAEAFTQIQYNTVQKLQRRFLWGVGMRYRFFEKEKIVLFAGTSIMYEFELLSITDSLNRLSLENQDHIRLNGYLSHRLKVNEHTSFTHLTYYQPVLTNWKDYRITSETSLQVRISKPLTLRLFFAVNYDSSPPQGVQELFYSFNNGLRYSF